MSSQKHYASCGIQTDSYDFSSVNQSLSPCKPKIFQCHVGHSCLASGSDVPSSGSDMPSSESDTTLANGSLGFESAYNQTPDSQDHDSPSLLSSRYSLERLTGIIYGRPSEARLSVKKRVLSLTSISPTGHFKTTMVGDKLRLVSMPERGKYASILAKDSLQEKQSVDDLNNTSNHEQMERPFPVDLPQTPSPPSSPESVTIIGNNAHLHGSFLRRAGCIDNDGWVSWANSPPRPIPALHGPASLPYARCPSGAEGTLVEGDDLSHKIWGLGSDGSHTVHLPTTSRPFVCQASQPQGYRPSQSLPTTASNQDEFTLSHYYERDAVIDLSRPATFYGHVGTQRVFSKPNVEQIVPALPISTSQQARITRLSDVRSFATLRAGNLNLEEGYKGGQSSTLAVGLGLHTWSSRGSTVENINPIHEILSNPLNTAAAIFVPASANVKAHFSKPKYTPQSEPYVLSAPRRPSDFNDTAEEHRQLDAQNPLPTPPSTSSPCWTPIFSHQPEMAIFNPKTSKVDSYSPKIYSPTSDLEDDSIHINAIMPKYAIHETDVVPRTSSFPNDPFTIQSYIPKLDSLPADDVSSCLRVTSGCLRNPFMPFPTNHENNLRDENLLQVEPSGTYVGIQGSTERRRNLSYQQPRSIPLARLIQRRLTSVAEEDQSTKVVFPFIQEGKKRGFTHSKGLSLGSLSRQMPRVGLLDEDIFTKEILDVSYHQPAYEDESDVVVKLPQKTSILRYDVDSNREQNFLRCDRQPALKAHGRLRPKVQGIRV